MRPETDFSSKAFQKSLDAKKTNQRVPLRGCLGLVGDVNHFNPAKKNRAVTVVTSCYSSSQVEFQIFKVVFSAWIGYSEMIPPRPFGNHVNHQPVLITSCDLRGRYLQIAESWHRISGDLWGNTKVIEKDQPELVVTAKITMKINAKSNRIFFWIIGWGMREKTAF